MEVFGTASTGETVHKLTLSAGDLTVALLTWGAAVQDVRMAGVPYGLTLGADNMADYEGELRHHGTLIGPVVNRNSTARVEIDGMMHELERNQDGRINLHSGKDATHRRLWQVIDHGPAHATLCCTLGDGICGLPGNRRITARFVVRAPACLVLDITAETDAQTVFNLANHSYWNLDGTSDWSDHVLQIAADHYLPTTADFTPTGEIVPVNGTAMDFRKPRTIQPNNPPLDNNFCLSEGPTDLRQVLTLTGKTGVGLRLSTDQPGVQLYDGRRPARPGQGYYEGIAIEAQHWPDATNHTGFPSIRATPEQPYSQKTQFEFFTNRT